jgi:hypothetical protein
MSPIRINCPVWTAAYIQICSFATRVMIIKRSKSNTLHFARQANAISVTVQTPVQGRAIEFSEYEM